MRIITLLYPKKFTVPPYRLNFKNENYALRRYGGTRSIFLNYSINLPRTATLISGGTGGTENHKTQSQSGFPLYRLNFFEIY